MNGQGVPVDPWRSFRGVMAATLVLEAIVVLLALPVVGTVGGGLTTASLLYLLGLTVALVALAGMQGRRWALGADLALQPLVIGGFVVYPMVGVIGVIFALVWLLIVYFRTEVARRQRHGLLPGQASPPAE